MKPPNISEMNLMETAPWMDSPDYRERFRAEYWQTRIRYERLKKMNTRQEAAALKDPRAEVPLVSVQQLDGTPAEVLRRQQAMMGEYLHILELRAELEGVEL